MARAKVKAAAVSSVKQRKKRLFAKKLLFAAKLLLTLVLLAISSLLYINLNRISDDFYQEIAKLGFVLEEITISGQNYSNNEQIGKALKLKKGMPIFSVSLSDLKIRLEKIEWIKQAIVERKLPNSIHISIVERVPIALGQKDRKLSLIDAEGVVINEPEIAKHLHLPIIIGEGAEIYASSLIEMVKSDEELFKRVNSIIMVSERRCNIRFDNGLEVKLPEENMKKAWEKVVKLYKKNELFLPENAVLDLRVENKIFVEKR